MSFSHLDKDDADRNQEVSSPKQKVRRCQGITAETECVTLFWGRTAEARLLYFRAPFPEDAGRRSASILRPNLQIKSHLFS